MINLIYELKCCFFYTDIKECSQTPKPCHQNAACTELQGSFNCSCNQGYNGNGTYCKGWLCYEYSHEFIKNTYSMRCNSKHFMFPLRFLLVHQKSTYFDFKAQKLLKTVTFPVFFLYCLKHFGMTRT